MNITILTTGCRSGIMYFRSKIKKLSSVTYVFVSTLFNIQINIETTYVSSICPHITSLSMLWWYICLRHKVHLTPNLTISVFSTSVSQIRSVKVLTLPSRTIACRPISGTCNFAYFGTLISRNECYSICPGFNVLLWSRYALMYRWFSWYVTHVLLEKNNSDVTDVVDVRRWLIVCVTRMPI